MIITNSLTGGGAERSMNLVCNELTRRGWSISLVPINAGAPDLVSPVCEVFPLERKWQGGLFNTLGALRNFRKVLKAWRPDIIVLNCDLPEFFGATSFGSHQLVVLEHASNPWGNRIIFGKAIRRILKLRGTNWVAVSSHLTIWPTAELPSAVLQNPIIPTAEQSSKVVSRKITRLVFIGRLSSEKRPELALEISKQTGIELVLIGDGRLSSYLKETANRFSIKATFLGRVENPWVAIQPGDLLIVPSLFEGDGLVVIEALQHRLPMLLSDIPDFRRFDFPDENYCEGLMGFSSKIQDYLVELPALLITGENANRILNPRSISSVGDAWERFLKEIC